MSRPASIHPDPNQLFDKLLADHELKNDAALSRALEVSPPVISKMRNGHLGLGASMLLAIHDYTGMPIRTIRSYLIPCAA